MPFAFHTRMRYVCTRLVPPYIYTLPYPFILLPYLVAPPHAFLYSIVLPCLFCSYYPTPALPIAEHTRLACLYLCTPAFPALLLHCTFTFALPPACYTFLLLCPLHAVYTFLPYLCAGWLALPHQRGEGRGEGRRRGGEEEGWAAAASGAGAARTTRTTLLRAGHARYLFSAFWRSLTACGSPPPHYYPIPFSLRAL